jgi:hypothetical protein
LHLLRRHLGYSLPEGAKVQDTKLASAMIVSKQANQYICVVLTNVIWLLCPNDTAIWPEVAGRGQELTGWWATIAGRRVKIAEGGVQATE